MVGNLPNFSKIDVLRCFLRFNKNVSRQELAKELELGEGTIRTILEILKSRNLLDSNKKGHFLSKKGELVLRQINSSAKSKPAAAKSLFPELEKIGVHIKGPLELKTTYKLRDLAVKNGADGALILEFAGKLKAPESGYEQNYGELEKLFELNDHDALIVAFSDEKRNAENGALAIAIELCDPLKKFISEL